MATWNHKLLLASAVLVVSAMCLDSLVGTNMSLIATRQGTSNTFDVSLSFTAMDENGTAIPGATLYCSDSSGGTYSQTGTADSQGKYSSSSFLVSTMSSTECPKKIVTRYCYAQKGDVKTNKVSGTAELTCYVAPTATVTSTATPALTATPTPTASAISPTSTPASYKVGDCVNLVGSIRKIIRISGDIYIYNSWWGTGWSGTEDGSFRISEIPSSIVSCPGGSTPTPTSTPRYCSGGTCQDVIQDCSSGTCYKKACMSPTVTGNTACSRLGLACLSSDCSGGCTDVPLRDCECRAKCGSTPTPTPTPTPSPTPTFDFSISIAPVDGSVQPGRTTNAQISANLVSGTSQSVALSGAMPYFTSTGEALGVGFSISQGTGTPPFISTLTISSQPTSPAGRYPITITATGGGKTRTATYYIAVTLCQGHGITGNAACAAIGKTCVSSTCSGGCGDAPSGPSSCECTAVCS